jgi:hypothetical protein
MQQIGSNVGVAKRSSCGTAIDPHMGNTDNSSSAIDSLILWFVRRHAIFLVSTTRHVDDGDGAR